MAVGAGSIQRAAGKSGVAKKAEPVKAAPAKKPQAKTSAPVKAEAVKPVRKAVYIGEELPIYLL